LFERRRLMKLVAVCAWCGKTISTGGTNCESESILLTHGICKECKEKALEEIHNEKPRNQEGR
jgi:hypothetical protein